MPRLEKNFQTEFKRAVDAYAKKTGNSTVYHKIIDAGYTNPFDCWVVTKGKFYALELKINKAKNTFNFKTFFRDREHELHALQQVKEAGGKAYVLINHFIPHKANKVYALEISQVKSIYNTIGSIKLDSLEIASIVIEKKSFEHDLEYSIREKKWDLSKLFNN